MQRLWLGPQTFRLRCQTSLLQVWLSEHPSGAPTAESTDSHLPIHHLAPQSPDHEPRASPATRKMPNQVSENRADLVTSARIQSQIFIQIRSPHPNSENQVHNFMKPDPALPMRTHALVLEGEKLMNPSFSMDYLKGRRTKEELEHLDEEEDAPFARSRPA
jgi:hypothetical protein